MTLFICLILSSIFPCAHELENEVHISLPEHSECFDDPLTMETCQAIVDEDPRQPTTSMNRSGVEPIDNDPRLEDPDYIWLKEQIEHCTCVCCHRSSLGGPGAYFWDIEHKPMWIDSANSWSLLVLSGQTEEVDQTLPSDDPERVLEIIEKERDRRREADSDW